MLLYLIRFEKMFKIGITKDINRIYKLVTTYKKFNPRLDQSYILHYYRASIVRDIEALIKDCFVESRYDFEGETFDGFTECFSDDCFEEVLTIVEFHVRTNNKNKTNVNENMKFMKGITKELLDIPAKKKKIRKQAEPFFKLSGDKDFLHFIENNKDNIWFELRKKNKNCYMTIHFQNYIPEKPPRVYYCFENSRYQAAGELINVLEYKHDYNFGLANFTFEINQNPLHEFCHVQFPNFASFYKEIFRVLNAEDKWIKIRDEYIVETTSNLLSRD